MIWITMLGRPGAGKSTLGRALADELPSAYCGGGQLLRAFAASDAPRAGEVARAQKAHEDVAPSLTYDALDARLASDPRAEAGAILDGFPKALAHWGLFASRYGAGRVDAALLVQVPIEVATDRPRHRLICSACDASERSSGALMVGAPCPVAGCSGTLSRRDDDEPDAIAERQADIEFSLLAERFAELGRLLVIDGTGSEEDVLALALEALRAEPDERARHSIGFMRSLRRAS